MPNWCESDLFVHGKPKMLRAFMEEARGPCGTSAGGETVPLSAHVFVPMPDEFWVSTLRCSAPSCTGEAADDTETAFLDKKCPRCGGWMTDSFNRGGYEWCCENWGTKWGLCDVALGDASGAYADPDDETLVYRFETAWAPPWPVLDAMARRFPGLVFALDAYERGVGQQYHAVWKKGRRVEDTAAAYLGTRGG